MTSSHAKPASRRALGALAVGAIMLSVLTACGGAQRKPDNDGAPVTAPAPAAEARTPIQQRRDVACDQLGPRITACAVEDARSDLAAGKIQKAQFDRDTAPAVQRKNTEEFLKACKTTVYSSRQIRVLEVCFAEETQCGPMLECLGHLSDTGSTKGRGAAPP